jgi:hypothetical protein
VFLGFAPVSATRAVRIAKGSSRNVTRRRDRSGAARRNAVSSTRSARFLVDDHRYETTHYDASDARAAVKIFASAPHDSLEKFFCEA